MIRNALLTALFACTLTTGVQAHHGTPHHYSPYPNRIRVETNDRTGAGITFRVRFLNAGDPRRVVMEGGKTGTLNCRHHTFRIDNGPTYFVDC